MLRITPAIDGWVEATAGALQVDGCAIVEGVCDDALLDETRAAMYRAQRAIREEVGGDRLARAGELGVLRLMARFEPMVHRYLELPAVLALVDRVLSPTAILHLQNGFILPSLPEGATPDVFQLRFHQDFPRVLGGSLVSFNILVAVDAFTPDRGATWVVPGTHQREDVDAAGLEAAAVCAECPAGSLVVFDSTLWHRAGHNTSGRDRLAINHQFTRSYIKQQIDYVRALGAEAVQAQPPRTQQLLGWYTRVVTSLDEYYQPEERRLYRRGQG